jgi:hypothetical protein
VTAPPVDVGLVATVDREARRALVEGRPGLDGIDFVEVLANDPTLPGHVPAAPRQRTLLVHLLNAPVPGDWDAGRVRVTGGVRPDPRVNPVRVEWAHPAIAVAGAPGRPPVPGLVAEPDRLLVDGALPADAAVRERVFVVRTTTSGDTSPYVLHLLGDGGAGVPAGFDVPLSTAPFTFTVDCPSDLDCCPSPDAQATPAPSAVVDYLARDAEALRIRLLDRLAALLPDWTDRSAADPAVMLVELFAHLGDRLAYWQDTVAVEAHLGTARQRTSVRRHARLLDYAVHEGCAARAWLALTTDVPTTVAGGAAVTDAVTAAGRRPVDAVEDGATVFETCADVRISPLRNRLPLFTWGDPDHVLPAGTTAAFLAHPTAAGDAGLAAGDVLILADCPASGLDGGSPERGDPALRHAVRLDRDPVAHTDPVLPGLTVLEIHWYADDALPTALRATEPGPGGRPATRAVALGNVVLADHGATVPWEDVVPAQVPAGLAAPLRYRPRLARPGLARVVAVDPAAAARPAAAVCAPDPRSAVAALLLDDGNLLWTPRTDLVATGRLAPHVVAEPEPDGTVRLRFGDGLTGRAPRVGARFRARYRVGGGTAGNVAAGVLRTWLRRPDGRGPEDAGAALTAWNPLAATGGTDPEPLEQVRRLAPSAYRRQLRAVTAADYAAVAEAVPGVQRSVARRRWTGSWYAHEVTVDPLAVRADDPAVPAAVLGLLEVRRMAGRDVEVVPPVSAPLHLRMFVCVAPGNERADVERRMRDTLSSRLLPGGVPGFFHPDRWTFGQALLLSDVVAAAMAVPGASWVELRRFARLGAPRSASVAALAAGRITAAPREVLRCDGDPNNPEAGRVDLVLGGGS